jgi:hypothetical protein
MADFCFDCTIRHFGQEYATRNDMAGLCKEDEMIGTLCEGCGGGYFDHEGKRVPCPDCGPEAPMHVQPEGHCLTCGRIWVVTS